MTTPHLPPATAAPSPAPASGTAARAGRAAAGAPEAVPEPAAARGTPPQLPAAGEAVAHTLLNCLLREVAGPEGTAAVAGGALTLRLPRTGVRLRVAVRRTSLLGAHRFAGPVSRYDEGRWSPIGWRRLAEHVRAELAARTGRSNEEFTAQVAASHQGVTAALAHPLWPSPAPAQPAAGADAGPPDAAGTGADGAPDPHARYLASERSLPLGHRFHPAPKAREAGPATWAAYSPEAGAAFPVRLLAVRDDLIMQECAEPGATAPLDALGRAPAGHTLLPVHPWQYELLCDHPVLAAALRRGDVRDLGPGDRPFAATASVRTLYDGETFLKFSLNVRITNCLRKNARYELAGAVAMTRLLGPVAADLAERFPGSAVLREPAYRSLALPGPGGSPDPDLLEGFGVIVREGLAGVLRPGATALLAAAVADEYPTGPAHVSRLLPPGAGPAAVLHWWRAYLALLVPPVLAAYLDHGVVLEPHLQNVLVCVDGDGMPCQVLFRDLEGAKLLPERHAAALAALPRYVAEPLGYDAEQGWTRLAYCLFVNNVGDMLAALADLCPGTEAALWRTVRAVLTEYRDRHGGHPRLDALLAGEPLPAKANLLTRWERSADRRASYVRLPSPLGPRREGAAAPVARAAGADQADARPSAHGAAPPSDARRDTDDRRDANDQRGTGDRRRMGDHCSSGAAR